MPVEIIIGKLYLATFSMSGILVIRPEEILISFTPIFFSLSKLLKSPGVEKKTTPRPSEIFFNLNNSSSVKFLNRNSLYDGVFFK